MNNKVKNIVLSIIFITFLFTFMIVNIMKAELTLTIIGFM